MNDKVKKILSKNKYVYGLCKFFYSYIRGFINKTKIYRKNKIFLKYGRDVLIDFDKACKDLNIDYWLEFGTLLGAVRDKGFILHDTDIDVGMYLNDYDASLEEKLEKFGFTKSRCFLIENGEYGREETYTKKGVNIDIFFFTKTNEYMYCHLFFNDPKLTWDQTIATYGGLIPGEYKFPNMKIATIEFLEYSFNIPNNYQEHLRSCYGDYMVKDKNYSHSNKFNQVKKEGKIGVLYENPNNKLH